MKIKYLVLFSIITLFISGLALKAEAATLYLMPQSQSVSKDDTFIIGVKLNTEGEEINTVQTNLKFLPDFLEVIDISKGGSILTLWVQEPSVREGELSFLGGIPGGFKGEGLILKINFLAKKIGKAEILFRENSKVLLNDGKGTPAKLGFLEGNYEIVLRPEKLPLISSRTHPDQNKWYKGNTLHLHWDLIEGAEYSFILSRDSLAEPDEIPDIPEGELIWMGDMEYPNLEDGIYYFHLRQKLSGEEWSPKATFREMIDATPPEEFKPEIGRDPAIFEGKYFLSFATIDATSGVDYFEVKEGKRDFKRAESPYLLEDQSLESKILVKAVDKAGNERIAEILPPEKPFPYRIVIFVGLVVIVIAVVWWLIKKLKIKKEK